MNEILILLWNNTCMWMNLNLQRSIKVYSNGIVIICQISIDLSKLMSSLQETFLVSSQLGFLVAGGFHPVFNNLLRFNLSQ